MSVAQTKSGIIQLIHIIPDPRQHSCNFKHPLASVIFITLVTALCGADDWMEVEVLGNVLKDWIHQFVPLPYGIPSHDTFGRFILPPID